MLENSLPGARFDQFNMVAQAAKVGLGIGLVPRFLFEAEIASKELFVPFNRPIFGEYKYYFVYPHRNSANAIVLDFKDWLLETARGERMVTSVGESEPNA